MVNQLKCVVVDDEQHAIDVLQTFILEIPSLELVQTFTHSTRAFQYLQQHKIDLLFLDIQMPGLSGLELIHLIPSTTKVILTTAYPDFALKSYELSVTDYLLKPILFDRFLKAIQKLMPPEKGDMDSASHPDHSDQPYLLVRSETRGKLNKINLPDILYIEALGNYVSIHTTQQKVLTLITMKEVEEKLSPHSLFIRIHKSYIINISHIKSIDINKVWIDKKEIPVGEKYKEGLMRMLDDKIL